MIRRWRSRWADKPRTADYAVQVLSRVLSYAVELGKITGNPCEGIKQLYSADRADIIWTDADTARIKQNCAAEIADAIDLAAHTGLRLGDLLRVSWSHIGTDEIVIRTGKSTHRREAIIPLYDDLRAVLARIPRRSTTILTNSKHRPWTRDGFGSSFNKAKIAAGMADADLPATICEAQRPRGSTSLTCPSGSSPASWDGKRNMYKIIAAHQRSATTKAIMRIQRKENVVCKT